MSKVWRVHLWRNYIDEKFEVESSFLCLISQHTEPPDFWHFIRQLEISQYRNQIHTYYRLWYGFLVQFWSGFFLNDFQNGKKDDFGSVRAFLKSGSNYGPDQIVSIRSGLEFGPDSKKVQQVRTPPLFGTDFYSELSQFNWLCCEMIVKWPKFTYTQNLTLLKAMDRMLWLYAFSWRSYIAGLIMIYESHKYIWSYTSRQWSNTFS